MSTLPSAPTPTEYAAMPWPSRQRLARHLALGREVERRASERAERRRLRDARARQERAARLSERLAAQADAQAAAERLLAAITPDDPTVIEARRTALIEATRPRRTK